MLGDILGLRAYIGSARSCTNLYYAGNSVVKRKHQSKYPVIKLGGRIITMILRSRLIQMFGSVRLNTSVSDADQSWEWDTNNTDLSTASSICSGSGSSYRIPRSISSSVMRIRQQLLWQVI